jgi:pSer/pThr/pTyr-binding forkhead associated (FHA) protein
VDIVLTDSAMSRQHAAIDYSDDGFRIQDLGSTNGLLLDEQPVQVGTLTHGSRFEIGGHVFQLVIEEREEAPEVYELPSES